MLPPSWNIKEPQRVCDACFGKLGPFQRRWVDLNANALRTNELASDDVTKQLNSPLRFTLGGEARARRAAPRARARSAERRRTTPHTHPHRV